ncbi:hypothetical protein MWG58_08305 [Streptomyces sp. WAC00276]|nr:hypothetical protein [Streptomyces sp. WAC00276]
MEPFGRPTAPPGPAGEPAAEARVPLHTRPSTATVADDGPSAGALPVGVPAAAVLASPLRLQRALRPLQAYRTGAAPRRQVLDEGATAELTARAGGLVLPVFRPVNRREALLQLVLDASGSMRVWQRLFDELREVFGGLGAFRDLHVRYLHATDDGRAAVSRSPRRDGAPLHSTDRLVDATGRRVTLLVSDCAGPLWHSGAAHRTLHRLAGQGPVAVLQPLPQRLWPRTRLQVTFGDLRRGQGVSGAGLLKVVSDGPPPPPGARPVPVLPPTAAALGSWARLLSGTGPVRTPGAVGWVSAAQEPARPVRARRTLTPLQLVSRFRSTASPAAGRLAVCLAAAPLNLPVMQLVQRTMLPDSGPAELAEVLLSGLLVRADEPGTGDGEQEQWYDFVPGVRQALLGPLGRDEAMLVLKHCSEYIEQRFGKGGPNFPALAYAQLGRSTATGPLPDTGRPARPGRAPGTVTGEAGEENAPTVPQPFAEVAADVLERFMTVPLHHTDPSPAPDGADHPVLGAAATLTRRYEEEGMVQYLMDAVQLLRGAAENSQGPPRSALWARYAREALRLWRVQGGRDLLTAAREAAERATAEDAGGRTGHRDILAATLHATAEDRRRRGDRHEALDLLRRADREYAVACAAPGLGSGQALRLTLARVRALETQWRLGGDSSLLQAAVGMLEAFTDIWPDQHRRPATLALAHGRTLLRLAGTGPPAARPAPTPGRRPAPCAPSSTPRRPVTTPGRWSPPSGRRPSSTSPTPCCGPDPSTTRRPPTASRRPSAPSRPRPPAAARPCSPGPAASTPPGTRRAATRPNWSAPPPGSRRPPRASRATPPPTPPCSRNGARRCCGAPCSATAPARSGWSGWWRRSGCCAAAVPRPRAATGPSPTGWCCWDAA